MARDRHHVGRGQNIGLTGGGVNYHEQVNTEAMRGSKKSGSASAPVAAARLGGNRLRETAENVRNAGGDVTRGTAEDLRKAAADLREAAKDMREAKTAKPGNSRRRSATR